MKKTIISLAILLSLSFAGFSQTITKDAKGNYTEAKDSTGATATKTGKIFTDKNGIVYDLYISKRGKLFVYKISKTTGKSYTYYLPLKD